MECERSNPTDPLRQGDIIAAHPQTNTWKDPWTRFGVILSADCDIANGKTGPGLVYVPIISHQTFLFDVWLPEEAQKWVRRGVDLIDRQLRNYPARVSYEKLVVWGAEGGAQNILAQLVGLLAPDAVRGPAEDAAKVIAAQWKAVNSLSECASRPRNAPFGELPKSVLQYYQDRHMLEPVKGDLTVVARRAVETALNSTMDRVDTWLIGAMIGLDPEMADATTFGFVVPLRAFNLMLATRIETDRSKWYGSTDSYLRICRLRGVYKADLVQKFANLFVRVGLEDYRTDEHRRLMKRCAENLFPGER